LKAAPVRQAAFKNSGFAGHRPKNRKSFGIGPQVRTNRVLQEARYIIFLEENYGFL
jgi:hypothetical protein